MIAQNRYLFSLLFHPSTWFILEGCWLINVHCGIMCMYAYTHTHTHTYTHTHTHTDRYTHTLRIGYRVNLTLFLVGTQPSPSRGSLGCFWIKSFWGFPSLLIYCSHDQLRPILASSTMLKGQVTVAGGHIRAQAELLTTEWSSSKLIPPAPSFWRTLSQCRVFHPELILTSRIYRWQTPSPWCLAGTSYMEQGKVNALRDPLGRTGLYCQVD